MIQCLWYQQAESIIYVTLGNADADLYKFKTIMALLDWWEKINNDEHGNHFHYRRKIISVCYFYWWNAREGSPGRNCEFEWTHGSENGQNHFARMFMGKQLDCNRSHDIVLTNYPWRSTPHIPAGQRSGTRLGIGPRVGTVNRVPEQIFARSC